MTELQLRLPESLVEPVSDALAEELGALSVAVEDADAGTGREQALFGEPGLPAPRAGWAYSSLSALFDTRAAAAEAASLLLAQEWARGIEFVGLSEVPDTDWVSLTQSQFEPVAITPQFWIVPSWHEPPAEARTLIRLDPGLAFGTGTHPTTQMCLRWIAAHARHWPRVLDYGCGSGILAIGAAMHGARAVDAVDIDPAAVQATRANAAANGVALTAGAAETAHGRYDLVLANILAKPLELLAPLLAGHVAAGGDLVLAGMLERQAGDLSAAYAPWLGLEVADRQDGWILMTAHRPVADPVA